MICARFRIVTNNYVFFRIRPHSPEDPHSQDRDHLLCYPRDSFDSAMLVQHRRRHGQRFQVSTLFIAHLYSNQAQVAAMSILSTSPLVSNPLKLHYIRECRFLTMNILMRV